MFRSNLPQIAGLPRSRDAQIIIVGNDKVGQLRIVPRVPFDPGQILSYPDSGPDAGKGHERNRGFERQHSSPQAVAPDAHDEIEFPFLGTEVLRESRETSLLFGGHGQPCGGSNADSGLIGSIILNNRHIDEKPIFPPARDPFDLSSDWEYPEILDEVRAFRDQSRLFGGPGFRGYQVSGRFFVGSRPPLAEQNPPRIVRAPNFGEWHAQLEEIRTGGLLFGVNSDAGLTGGIVLNERNFDIANPAASSPGAQTPRSLISVPTSTIDDKQFYFRFDFVYYRMR